MTDRFKARWSALVDRGHELADAGAASASTRCSRTSRWCIDKWFALQAGAPGPRRQRAAERVKQLMKHPDFNIAQPEPRAQPDLQLLQRATRARFHRADARRLRVLGRPRDRARRASTRRSPRGWRARWTAGASWPSRYRSAAREAIARVAAKPDLSNDVREVVTRALLGRADGTPWQHRRMTTRKKNAFYAQSGGVTAVINASRLRRHRDRARAQATRSARSTPAATASSAR